jgi:hypothetical protein
MVILVKRNISSYFAVDTFRIFTLHQNYLGEQTRTSGIPGENDKYKILV